MFVAVTRTFAINEVGDFRSYWVRLSGLGRQRNFELRYEVPADRLKIVEYAAEFGRNREVGLFRREELVEWGAE